MTSRLNPYIAFRNTARESVERMIKVMFVDASYEGGRLEVLLAPGKTLVERIDALGRSGHVSESVVRYQSRELAKADVAFEVRDGAVAVARGDAPLHQAVGAVGRAARDEVLFAVLIDVGDADRRAGPAVLGQELGQCRQVRVVELGELPVLADEAHDGVFLGAQDDDVARVWIGVAIVAMPASALRRWPNGHSHRLSSLPLPALLPSPYSHLLPSQTPCRYHYRSSWRWVLLDFDPYK